MERGGKESERDSNAKKRRFDIRWNKFWEQVPQVFFE